MADPQAPAAAVTPVPGPAQPAAPVDDGYERVSRDELQTLRRERERARGMEGFFQKANSLGLKRVEDLDGFGKFQDTLKSRNLSMEQLLKAFEEPEAPEGGAVDFAAIEKQLNGRYVPADQFEAKLGEHSKLIEARFEHKQTLAAERAVLDKALAELTKGANPRDQYLIEQAFRAAVSDDKRPLYPAGHPLHQEALAPFDEKGLKGIVDDLKKRLALAEGEDMAQ